MAKITSVLCSLLAFIAVIALLSLLANIIVPAFDWICNNITMWTPQVGYLPWILLITAACIYAYIINLSKQPD